MPARNSRPCHNYQSGREFDDELVEQLETLPEFVAACGFANAKVAGYEADDFPAAVAKEEKRGGSVVVATGDRDGFQLASERTTIIQPIKAGELARIGPDEVDQRYGIKPAQVPDFIALRSDASDRIPGAAGVGPKTAAALLRKYGTLEELLAAGRFQKTSQAAAVVSIDRHHGQIGATSCLALPRSRPGIARRHWRGTGD